MTSPHFTEVRVFTREVSRAVLAERCREKGHSTPAAADIEDKYGCAESDLIHLKDFMASRVIPTRWCGHGGIPTDNSD